MKDMHSHIKPVAIVGPVSLGADNTPAALDLQGYQSCEVIIGVGIGGITFTSTDKIEFTLTHSDDDVTYSDVADADMLGVTGITSGIIKSLTAAHAAAAVYNYGYVGGKRYLKLLANFSGTHGANTPLALMLIKGNPAIAAAIA